MANVPTADQKHILVINNSPDVMALMRDLLEEEGYRVTTQRLQENHLDVIVELGPDLIILDYMWEYMDSGWSLLQTLRMKPETAQTPIVVCTAAVKRAEELEPHFLTMGVSLVLKPFDIETLIEHVAGHLQDKPSDYQQPAST